MSRRRLTSDLLASSGNVPGWVTSVLYTTLADSTHGRDGSGQERPVFTASSATGLGHQLTVLRRTQPSHGAIPTREFGIQMVWDSCGAQPLHEGLRAARRIWSSSNGSANRDRRNRARPRLAIAHDEPVPVLGAPLGEHADVRIDRPFEMAVSSFTTPNIGGEQPSSSPTYARGSQGLHQSSPYFPQYSATRSVV